MLCTYIYADPIYNVEPTQNPKTPKPHRIDSMDIGRRIYAFK